MMIAYYYPPEGNAGTYRPLRFSRSLAALGWDVRVISADPCLYERYDPELLKSVSPEISVVRVPGHDWWQNFQAWRKKRGKRLSQDLSREMLISVHKGSKHTEPNPSWRSRIRRAVRRMEYMYYIPDRAMPWIGPAVTATCQSCLARKPDMIWATIGPISSGVVALQVSRQTDVPYVLDFRDPWGLNFFHIDLLRPAFAIRKVKRMMSQLFEEARSVVFLFESVAERYLQAYPGALDDKKIHIIPNGFEGKLEAFSVFPSEKCTIVYAGTLSTYRYDTLLLGLKMLKQTHPMLAEQVQIRFVGDGNEPLKKEVLRIGLSDIVETMGAVSYQDIQQIQQHAHALLILGRSSEIRGHELVAGAKLFGYLKARRPIIGVLPRDETRNVLTDVGVRTIADVDSPEDIAVVFMRVIEAWAGGRLHDMLPDAEACLDYSLEQQTNNLIYALEGRHVQYGHNTGTMNLANDLREDTVR